MQYLLHVGKEIEGWIAPNGDWITIGDSFEYEISIYKIYKNRLEYHGSKFIKSIKPLNIKNKAIYKRTKDYIIGKFIDWIKAPEDYIKHLTKINVRKYRTTKKRK